MARMTLLEMVQDILNDLSSDSVNSIDDTEESIQVAQIVKTAYYKLINQRDDWPFLRTLTELTGLGDVDNPTKMQLQEGVNKVYWIRYNRVAVAYLKPEDFKALIDRREEQDDVVDENGYIINRDPICWTSYDDEYVHFDSYNGEEEATLQSSNSALYAIVEPAWEAEDEFIPTLPSKMFPILLADAKGTAFLTLKEQANPKEENYASAGKARMQRASHRINDNEPKSNDGVNYGRK